MKTSLIINQKVLNQFDITATDLIYLYYVKHRINLGINMAEINPRKLENRRLIKIINEVPYLRQEGKDLLKFCEIEADLNYEQKKKIVKVSDRAMMKKISEFVPEFRAKWKGLKPGSMGSREAVEAKLKRWINNNPDVDFDVIAKAADNYLASVEDPRFLQRADYFIYKQDSNKDASSRLSAYVDEILMGIEQNNNEDWTAKIN